jgi:DNA-binding response OmpR family regulator
VDPKTVLVVDEAEKDRAQVRHCLAERKLVCREASTAHQALEMALQEPPDLILLDLYLPDQSGLGLCRTVRESEPLCDTPIIVLSSHASEIDRVLAFESGVDDFLAKPFSEPELLARIRALIRRGRVLRARSKTPVDPAADVGVRLDRGAWRVEVAGEPLYMTVKEFEILWTLNERDTGVVRRRDLIDAVWGKDAQLTDRAIDSHVKSIRRKLGENRELLETVHGLGYRFNAAGAVLIPAADEK